MAKLRLGEVSKPTFYHTRQSMGGKKIPRDVSVQTPKLLTWKTARVAQGRLVVCIGLSPTRLKGFSLGVPSVLTSKRMQQTEHIIFRWKKWGCLDPGGSCLGLLEECTLGAGARVPGVGIYSLVLTPGSPYTPASKCFSEFCAQKSHKSFKGSYHFGKIRGHFLRWFCTSVLSCLQTGVQKSLP